MITLNTDLTVPMGVKETHLYVYHNRCSIGIVYDCI